MTLYAHNCVDPYYSVEWLNELDLLRVKMSKALFDYVFSPVLVLAFIQFEKIFVFYILKANHSKMCV